MSSTTSTDTPSNVSGNSNDAKQTTTEGLSTFTEVATTPKVAVSESRGVPRIDPQTADAILLREHLIHTLTVNGTEIYNANLFGAFDPFNALLAQTKVQDAIKHFAYIRGDIVVTARITPPGSCFGAMVFSAICEGGLDFIPNNTVNVDLADDLVRDSLFTSFNDMYQMINFEQASTVSLELPFVYHSHYVPTAASSRWMWRLQLQSLVPLQSTISTTAVAEIKVYASMKPGYELAMPIYQAKRPVSNTAGLNPKKKGAVSDVASQVAGLANSVAGYVPALAPFATPVAVGASAISAVASFFGFTRETSFNPPEPVVHRLFSSSTLVDGVDTGDALVSLTGASLSIDPAIGEGEHDDLMCFESLRQRWGCVSAFTLTTASPSGNMIYSLPVSPSYAGGTLGIAYLTPGGYFGLPFNYWRGGMEYLIYIPSSPNMRGMLQICYNPGIDVGPFPHVASDPTGSVHTVSLDLSGTQQHLIQVPYASPDICKENLVIVDGINYGRNLRYANGSLDFYLSAAWVAPRAGVVSTRVIILARPMSDMVFSDPRTTIPGRGNIVNAICYQSTIDESVSMIETTLLGQALEQEFNLGASATTEVAPSARALVQKLTKIYSRSGIPEDQTKPNFRLVQALNPMTDIGATTWMIAGDVPDVTVNVAPMPFSWYKYYTMLFVGVRGGTRAKIVVRNEEVPYTHGSVTGTQSPNARLNVQTTSSFGTIHSGYQLSSYENAVEFAFPYVSDRLYLNPRVFNTAATSLSGPNAARGQRLISVTGGAEVHPDWDLLYAGSSDCSVTRFRRVPGLVAARIVGP